MLTIRSNCPIEEPPLWARLERQLITDAGNAIDPIFEAYTREDDSMLWPPADDYQGMDALDDAYESFHNWPLFYTLGGDRLAFERGLAGWESITKQFADVPTGLGHPQVVRDYQQGHDWFHQSEGNLLFYHLCMAEPDNDVLRDHAFRFAGFYLNEHPAVPDNYDPDRHLVYCPMNGSAGPAYHNYSADVPPAMYHAHSETRIPWGYEEWKERYGLPYYDLDGIESVEDLREETNARRMGEAIRDRCARSDTPQNLALTSLLANAYLLSGADRYREWITEYVDAWIERASRNGGVLPDNVDHDDEIGGTFEEDGRWFGGWYGWTWPHGLRSIAPAFTAAAENALLVTGERSYLELPRSQFDRLEARGYEKQGTQFVPYRYGTAGDYPRERGQDPDADRGWFDFAPAPVESLVHVWYSSLANSDRNRLERSCERTVEEWRTEGLENWLKDFGGNEHPWLAYLAGNYPTYPIDVLQKDLDHVRDRLSLLETDDQDPADYDDYYFAKRNPVPTEALVQLTTGAPQEIFNGGIPVSVVRHFDPERERPGLPPDVAALVSRIDGHGVTLELVNLADDERVLTVQAGGFGEHEFVAVTETDDRRRPVADRHLSIEISSNSRTTLDLELDRFVNRPTYDPPWY